MSVAVEIARIDAAKGDNAPMMLDPVATNPDLYRVLYENDAVRVLEYHDRPGDRTKPHWHPDSVMYTLSSFRRLLVSGGQERQVEIAEGSVSWVPAQEHSGENVGDTETRVIFVEMKGSSSEAGTRLGPEQD